MKINILAIIILAQGIIMSKPIFELTSGAFKEGQSIPSRFTCDGNNISPDLSWRQVPDAQSYVLIVDDPDAPKKFLKEGEDAYVHWILFNIPQSVHNLAEGESIGAPGLNSNGKKTYMGPCPPPGNPHRYFFKLYALNEELPLHQGASKQDVLKAMEGHIIAQASLMGLYKRS